MSKQKVSLPKDANRVITETWLQPGESVITYCPSRGHTFYFDIPGRKHNGKHWWPTWKDALYFPVYLLGICVIIVLSLLLQGNPSGPNPRKKLPGFFAWGKERDCQAALVGVGDNDGHGLWVLTDRRLGLLTVNPTRSQRRRLSADSPRSPHEWDVLVHTEVPGREFTYQGPVVRNRPYRRESKQKQLGKFHRIMFRDGSTMDVASLSLKAPPRL